MPPFLIMLPILLMARDCIELISMGLSPWLAITVISELRYFHHNIDRGKVGIILDAHTTSFYGCVNIEVDASGNVLKTWNLADIISAAMRAGGDDPSRLFTRRQTTGSTTTPWLTIGPTTR